MTTPEDEIIIEVRVQGASQRVSAIDARTLVEVVFQAPLAADRASLERLARQKLAWRQGRTRDPASGDRPARAAPRRPDGGGILV